MNERAVLTAIGEDRPGLVEEVSEFVFARGGSIEDSRMANMQGQFAIMMVVGGTQQAIERIASDLETLSLEAGLHAQLTPTGRAAAAATPRLAYRLTGRALDQSGLVHQVANLLRSLDVNIESMDTDVEAAPVTGAPIFAMELVIAVPQETPIQKLRDELAAMCDSLNIDWHLALL
jgi:glycine cleavage system transcriptional repressor